MTCAPASRGCSRARGSRRSGERGPSPETLSEGERTRGAQEGGVPLAARSGPKLISPGPTPERKEHPARTARGLAQGVPAKGAGALATTSPPDRGAHGPFPGLPCPHPRPPSRAQTGADRRSRPPSDPPQAPPSPLEGARKGPRGPHDRRRGGPGPGRAGRRSGEARTRRFGLPRGRPRGEVARQGPASGRQLVARGAPTLRAKGPSGRPRTSSRARARGTCHPRELGEGRSGVPSRRPGARAAVPTGHRQGAWGCREGPGACPTASPEEGHRPPFASSEDPPTPVPSPSHFDRPGPGTGGRIGRVEGTAAGPGAPP